jgi:hypothetical protein
LRALGGHRLVPTDIAAASLNDILVSIAAPH